MSIFIPLRGHSKAIVIPSAAQRSCGILLSTTSDETQSPLRNRNPFPLSSRRDPAPVKTGGGDPSPSSPSSRHSRADSSPLKTGAGIHRSRSRRPIPYPSVTPSLVLASRSCPRADGGTGAHPLLPLRLVIPARAGIQGWGIVPLIIKTLAASPKQAFALQGEK